VFHPVGEYNNKSRRATEPEEEARSDNSNCIDGKPARSGSARGPRDRTTATAAWATSPVRTDGVKPEGRSDASHASLSWRSAEAPTTCDKLVLGRG